MKTAVSPCSSPTETLADLATKQERLVTTARAFQTTGLTNGRVANWVPEVEFSPFRVHFTVYHRTILYMYLKIFFFLTSCLLWPRTANRKCGEKGIKLCFTCKRKTFASATGGHSVECAICLCLQLVGL